MNTDELKTILEQHKLWLENEGGARADLQGADLRDADLRGADLQRADLQGADLRDADLQDTNLQWANLRWADLRGADLQDTNLRDADLRWADLRGADLQGAYLRGADLQRADLRGANLQGADLDYTCLPLWCGSRGMIVDKCIAAQIAAHFCALDCDDADYLAAQTAILEFAKTSHRAGDLGLLEECEK